jgi:hypothetical protein
MDSGALFSYSSSLPRGLRVRLRLARSRDAGAIRALLRAADRDIDELDLARLVRFDPRRQFVVCATTLTEGREEILGVGAIAIAQGAEAEPHLLVVDQDRAQGLAELLRGALISRAITSAETRVA